MVTMVVIVRRFVWRISIFHHPTSSVFDFFSYFCIIFLDVISMPCYLYIYKVGNIVIQSKRVCSLG